MYDARKSTTGRMSRATGIGMKRVPISIVELLIGLPNSDDVISAVAEKSSAIRYPACVPAPRLAKLAVLPPAGTCTLLNIVYASLDQRER